MQSCLNCPSTSNQGMFIIVYHCSQLIVVLVDLATYSLNVLKCCMSQRLFGGYSLLFILMGEMNDSLC